MVCSECAGAHTHHDAQRRVWVAQQTLFWPIQRISVALLKSFPSRYPHPPNGGSMLRSFARTFASSGIFLLFPLFVQAQALSFTIGTASAAPGQNQRAIWKSPLVSTPLPIFPSS